MILTGLRAGQFRQANVRDIRTTQDGAAIIHAKGKGGKDRSVPIEAMLLGVNETYLDSRAVRFPPRPSAIPTLPSQVSHDGLRYRRSSSVAMASESPGTPQSRIKRAFKRASPDAQPVPGALVHGLRHTFATELAGSDVSVYTLMKLLGHESTATWQRNITAAGTETRSAAAQTPFTR